MSKPNKDNLYIKTAISSWHVPNYGTFLLMENYGGDGGYNVRVFPDSDEESYWMPYGPWETEGGAAWSILNELDDGDRQSLEEVLDHSQK